MKIQIKGFTLVELLVSMAVLGIILVSITGIFSSANQIGRTVSSQTALQQELRTAGNLITDEIQRAIYVYPPCGIYSFTAAPEFKTNCAASDFPSATTLPDTTKMYVGYSELAIFSSGMRGQKPDGTYNWKVGDASAPILALIASPRQPWRPCDAGSKVNLGGCYTFIAYFAVTRKQVTRGYTDGTNTNGADSRDLLDPNLENANQWVLMEYRRSLSENLSDYSGFSAIKNATILGVGVQSDNTLTTYNGNKLSIPGIRWRDAGCNFTDVDTPTNAFGTIAASPICGAGVIPPSADPNATIQRSADSLPVLEKNTSDPNILALFATRINATTLWIENNNNKGTAKILVENIDPVSGFKVDFPDSSVDPRGVLQVRLTLQGSIIRSGQKSIFPQQPLEYFAVPRNLTP